MLAGPSHNGRRKSFQKHGRHIFPVVQGAKNLNKKGIPAPTSTKSVGKGKTGIGKKRSPTVKTGTQTGIGKKGHQLKMAKKDLAYLNWESLSYKQALTMRSILEYFDHQPSKQIDIFLTYFIGQLLRHCHF